MAFVAVRIGPVLAISILLGGPAFAQIEPPPPAVTVVAAPFGPIAERVGLTGTLVARDEVMVSPRVSDLAVTAILAEEGDRVAAGQVLARLARDQVDTALLQNTATTARAEAAVAQARAGILEAAAARTQADLALARTRDLAGHGNAARETVEVRDAAAQTASARYEASQTLLRAAAADLAMAGAQRRELEVRLGYTELRAPVAGLVSRRTARVGAVVSSAGEPLFRLIEGGVVELVADVPEVLLARLRPGQPAALETVSGARSGAVRLVSPEVRSATRLGSVRLSIEDDAGGLVIGSFARASVEVARVEGVLLPLSAVLFPAGGAAVQVVVDGVVQTRQVRLGLRADGMVQIASGVAAGERVVAVAGSFVRDGDRVTAVPRS